MKLRYLLCLCIAAVIPIFSQAEPSGEVRYVWARNLMMRSAPDRKGDEVARLPYGTKVTLLQDSSDPLPHRETVAKLRAITG